MCTNKAALAADATYSKCTAHVGSSAEICKFGASAWGVALVKSAQARQGKAHARIL